MAMKDSADEFKADAVALYESTPGRRTKGAVAEPPGCQMGDCLAQRPSMPPACPA